MTEERSDSPNWKAVAEDVADWIDELCVGTLRSDTKRQVADFVRKHYKPRPEAKFAKSTEERSDSPHMEAMMEVTDEMINRFLSWPLPDSVCSDLCVTQRDYGKAQGWPKRVGTNLLTADEARQMLEYVLSLSA
jgi:hypothetical protein